MKAGILGLVVAGLCSWCAPQALAAWERQVIDIGGIPGGEFAISGQTSRIYVPMLQQKALTVVEPGGATRRVEMDIRPTTLAYSASTGRFFVLGMFDNAVVVIDEASGAMTRLAVGSYPDNVVVDEARGKVYVSNWGGITGQGAGISIIDSSSLAVRTVAIGNSVVAMAHDPGTGRIYVSTEAPGSGRTLITELDAQGNFVASAALGHRAYSLAVDPRTSRIYVAGLSKGPPFVAGEVARIFRVYSPGLQLVTEHVWPAGSDWLHLEFAIDPVEPGLFFGTGQNTMLFRVDADGGNLRAWNLPMGSTRLEDGRTVMNGVLGLTADPLTGNIFVSSRSVGEFDPRTGAIEFVEMPPNTGLSGVHFWPDSRRMLVLTGGQLTVLTRPGF